MVGISLDNSRLYTMKPNYRSGPVYQTNHDLENKIQIKIGKMEKRFLWFVSFSNKYLVLSIQFD